MKFCQSHWDDLRAAVRHAGMEVLVPETAGAAIGNMIDDAQHGTTVDNFDPLTRAHFAIGSNALAAATKNDPTLARWMAFTDACPLCVCNFMVQLGDGGSATIAELTTRLAEGRVTGQFDVWIALAVAEQVSVWRSLGT